MNNFFTDTSLITEDFLLSKFIWKLGRNPETDQGKQAINGKSFHLPNHAKFQCRNYIKLSL